MDKTCPVKGQAECSFDEHRKAVFHRHGDVLALLLSAVLIQGSRIVDAPCKKFETPWSLSKA